MAMDSIMQYVSEHKSDTSLMFMLLQPMFTQYLKKLQRAAQEKFKSRSQLQKMAAKGVSVFH